MTNLNVPPALFAFLCFLAVIGGCCIIGSFIVLGIILRTHLTFKREEKRRKDDIYQGMESSLLGEFKKK